MDLYAHNFSSSIYLTGHLIGVVHIWSRLRNEKCVLSDIEQDMTTFYEKCRKELVTHVHRRVLSKNLNSGFGYGSMADDVTNCSKVFEKVQLRKVAQFIDEFV